MAMGSEGKVILNGEMKQAMADCKSYRGKIEKLKGELEGIMKTLENGFRGKAADGLNHFYTNSIVEFFNSTFNQFLEMFDKEENGLFDAIQRAFLLDAEAIDPSLGESNRSLSQSGETQ